MTDYTSSVTIISTAYTSIGTGPLAFTLVGPYPMWMVIADTQPPTTQVGELITFSPNRVPVPTSSVVWLQMVQEGTTGLVEVSLQPGMLGSGSGSGGSSLTNYALETGGNLATIASAVATAANQALQTTQLTAIANAVANTNAGVSDTAAVPVQGVTGGVAMPVSAATLPLPSGAATSAIQTTQQTSLTAIAAATGTTADTAYAGSGSASIVAAVKGVYTKLAASIAVTGTFYQATQPVSIASAVAVTGTFYQATQPVSLATLPALTAGTAAIGSIINTNNPVGAASFATAQASVTTTAASVLAARAGAVGTGRISVTIYNLGSVTAYIGASTSVTSATGLPILPGGSYTKNTTAALYAITASGTTTLAFDEEY